MRYVSYQERHIGPNASDTDAMLRAVGVSSLDELIERTIPDGIRSPSALDVGPALTERQHLEHMKRMGAMNKVFRSYIGLGFSGTVLPPPIQRNIFENPGWYTAYTPYQAEISQGRLEALLNFQTMISDLTGLPISNASLLDEATGIGEAMHMLYAARPKEMAGAKKIFVDRGMYPQNLDVLRTRCTPIGVEVVVGDAMDLVPDGSYFALALQYPTTDGSVNDYRELVARVKGAGVRVAVCADLLSLVLLTPPGEWGADVCVGNSQRFGVPMGYGGPHAGYFATTEEFKRIIPGRIIGVSQDRRGRRGLRMALQTREQHIRRDKATSNICTAQALLAVMASMYAVYHGPHGLDRIANNVQGHASDLAHAAKELGYGIVNAHFFDTVTLTPPSGCTTDQVRSIAESKGINFRYVEGRIGIALDETVRPEDMNEVIGILAKAVGKTATSAPTGSSTIPKHLRRTSPILSHPVFNSYHTELELQRYIRRLENKDFSLVHGMIPLGSCTMKLNAASTLIPLTAPEWANLHPFIPVEQAAGYHKVFAELSDALAKATGFTAVSLQPNSGAQGEYAGLLTIRAYHKSRGDEQRTIALIPSSAHGTNPASAVMAGMQVVVVKADAEGHVDVADLKAKAEQYKDTLSCLMVTYPSTHGVYEAAIREITSTIHANGGLVYMDGANMNAQVGLTSPGEIGADVCHLNLHKTFAIPHGGGGPGVGPICVNDRLKPFLPGHALIKTGGEQAVSAVSSAPWGSALILLISYGYIKMLGGIGLTDSTRYAILNANYLRVRLQDHYPILYNGEEGMVAHEMILDCRSFKRTAGIEVEDIAKRLMDYGFHAPTVSFPVAGTLMVEPTESEAKVELDRFVDAMISIRREITEVENGTVDKADNVLKMAPHTSDEICADTWSHSYGREKAAFPMAVNREWKYWPMCSRVDSAYGDRNLICTCPPIEEYATEVA
ncbi:MAG: aminomethyl-transferring glycine dehydrogenase [Flavobacteriales bacterium]|jgi:glycine dehydrogenase|nr:aminomethyl-transferring glycine dehydrogenase [Flavobacteriales bacterium]MBK6883499.1 aminomethyl-transferring glycine dehydrogenase [Flavobacteriales bacterium]MBK7102331.1 aminomethyl-transferring glycine dehydrogenase [Flavobacteriales bacterium]MBK7113069.1 aminomethyl-transferring glycine dehydrogenase [Flavobacteriales bacterium]MBK7482934.1 aminomethyl-transferring glycine dehydrogenase [Flavobacteriales bacterium]